MPLSIGMYETRKEKKHIETNLLHYKYITQISIKLRGEKI